jgi:hypothetical protein
MVAKLKLAPRNFPPALPAEDCELEWLFCLCSTYQATRRWLSRARRPIVRSMEKRVIPASSLRKQTGRDFPAGARPPLKSPVRTLRDTSRKQLAG